MPEVSIITAAYLDSPDKLAWFEECLRSVLEQDFTDYEHVVVDDGSPMDPAGALAAAVGSDARFFLYRGAGRQGPAACRNTACALARGAALLPLDADDRLAGKETLRRLLDAWRPDHARVVYGDLQRLEQEADGVWRPGRTFQLPDYSFERVLDPSGIMPVTALHSIECHRAAGGWKTELDAGLEDVEYWIAAGERGYCGLRIPATTLLYRRHAGGRANVLRSVLRRETEMRNKIRELHRDSYEGRYMAGCCGGGRANVVAPSGSGSGAAAASTPRPARLDQYGSGEKVWVEYIGARTASFGVSGQFTGLNYKVDGKGHRFEVHTGDLPIFRRSGRGRDFRVGVAPPEGAVVTPAAPASAGPPPAPSAPALATLERREPVRVATAPPTPASPPGDVALLALLEAMHLGQIAEAMLTDGWTVARLAAAQPAELTRYRGVGAVRAAQMIGRAREAA